MTRDKTTVGDNGGQCSLKIKTESLINHRKDLIFFPLSDKLNTDGAFLQYPLSPSAVHQIKGAVMLLYTSLRVRREMLHFFYSNTFIRLSQDFKQKAND